ncbi:hypothetical protein BC629DRAFT_1443075 [Irpex lacteus]|nr:hypothetical protein BC629DRAFT_1443075 [Irpex lacteus]
MTQRLSLPTEVKIGCISSDTTGECTQLQLSRIIKQYCLCSSSGTFPEIHDDQTHQNQNDGSIMVFRAGTVIFQRRISGNRSLDWYHDTSGWPGNGRTCHRGTLQYSLREPLLVHHSRKLFMLAALCSRRPSPLCRDFRRNLTSVMVPDACLFIVRDLVGKLRKTWFSYQEVKHLRSEVARTIRRVVEKRPAYTTNSQS